jgi:hypothetical protein
VKLTFLTIFSEFGTYEIEIFKFVAQAAFSNSSLNIALSLLELQYFRISFEIQLNLED